MNAKMLSVLLLGLDIVLRFRQTAFWGAREHRCLSLCLAVFCQKEGKLVRVLGKSYIGLTGGTCRQTDVRAVLRVSQSSDLCMLSDRFLVWRWVNQSSDLHVSKCLMEVLFLEWGMNHGNPTVSK